jgi:hypothetical protein
MRAEGAEGDGEESSKGSQAKGEGRGHGDDE